MYPTKVSIQSTIVCKPKFSVYPHSKRQHLPLFYSQFERKAPQMRGFVVILVRNTAVNHEATYRNLSSIHFVRKLRHLLQSLQNAAVWYGKASARLFSGCISIGFIIIVYSLKNRRSHFAFDPSGMPPKVFHDMLLLSAIFSNQAAARKSLPQRPHWSR